MSAPVSRAQFISRLWLIIKLGVKKHEEYVKRISSARAQA